MSVKPVKWNASTRTNVQIFWFLWTIVTFGISELFGIRGIFMVWIAFLIVIAIACIAVATVTVRVSRNGRYRMSPKELDQFSTIFDGYIAIIPFFGSFIHRSGPVQRLSEELTLRKREAYERRLVARYSRG